MLGGNSEPLRSSSSSSSVASDDASAGRSAFAFGAVDKLAVLAGTDFAELGFRMDTRAANYPS